MLIDCHLLMCISEIICDLARHEMGHDKSSSFVFHLVLEFFSSTIIVIIYFKSIQSFHFTD